MSLDSESWPNFRAFKSSHETVSLELMSILTSRLKVFFLAPVFFVLKRTGFAKGRAQRFVRLSVLCTSLLASLSGAYAFYSVFKSSPLSLCFGLLLGSIIFSLDSFLVDTLEKRKIANSLLPKRGRQILNMLICVCPRLILGILIAVTVAVPIQLKLFQREIEVQLVRARLIAFADIANRVDQNFSQLHELVDLTRNLRVQLQEKKRESEAFQLAQNAKLQGSAGTMKAGEGPAYKQKQQLALRSNNEVKNLTANVGPIIQKNESRIASLSDERDSLINQEKRRANVDNSSGMLERIQALQELSNTQPLVKWTMVLLTLLFVFLEITPIVVKLLAGEPTDDNVGGGFMGTLLVDGTIGSGSVSAQYKQSGAVELGVLFLELILPTKDRDHLIGDLIEEYDEMRMEGRGQVSSLLWFYKQITTSITPILVKLLIDVAARRLRQ